MESNKVIKGSVIMRTGWNALLSVFTALSFDIPKDNLFRIYRGNEGLLTAAVAVLILDTALALLWLYKKIFHTIHFILYILTGGVCYGILIANMLPSKGTAGILIEILFMMPVMFLLGLIPFIVCAVERRKITKKKKAAKAAQDSAGPQDDLSLPEL